MGSWAQLEVALDFGPSCLQTGAVRTSRRLAREACWVAVEQVALDFGQAAEPRRPKAAIDPRLWRGRYAAPVTPEDEREIRANLEGFFSLLSEWAA